MHLDGVVQQVIVVTVGGQNLGQGAHLGFALGGGDAAGSGLLHQCHQTHRGDGEEAEDQAVFQHGAADFG